MTDAKRDIISFRHTNITDVQTCTHVRWNATISLNFEWTLKSVNLERHKLYEHQFNKSNRRETFLTNENQTKQT